jgi:hypothetical protein
MNDIIEQDTVIKEAITQVRGIQGVYPINIEDRDEILALEEEAEKRSLMGLGKVINSGIRKVLQYDSIYVALTNMDFNWSHCSALILKKGDQIVGEDVYDEAVLAKLSESPNTWFMHKNFVIYKDRVAFPQDIMQKICHFELPGMPADWIFRGEDSNIVYDIWYANPSSLGDVYLKKHYFGGTEEQGLGTILIGINTRTIA